VIELAKELGVTSKDFDGRGRGDGPQGRSCHESLDSTLANALRVKLGKAAICQKRQSPSAFPKLKVADEAGDAAAIGGDAVAKKAASRAKKAKTEEEVPGRRQAGRDDREAEAARARSRGPVGTAVRSDSGTRDPSGADLRRSAARADRPEAAGGADPFAAGPVYPEEAGTQDCSVPPARAGRATARTAPVASAAGPFAPRESPCRQRDPRHRLRRRDPRFQPVAPIVNRPAAPAGAPVAPAVPAPVSVVPAAVAPVVLEEAPAPPVEVEARAHPCA